MATDAVTELREAVLACRANGEWWIEDRPAFDMFRYSISRWVDDLGRSLNRVNAAIGKSREHSGAPDEEMALQLEEALMQIGSGRDKLVAIAAQVFGVPSLVHQKPGIKFEPRDTAVKKAFSQLGCDGHRDAGQVKKRLDALDRHDAISLRNQIIHALSPLGAVVKNTWIRRADLDEKGGIRIWDRGPLYPKGTLDQGDLKPETIWSWAVGSAASALDLLVEATEALAKLVREVGVIPPPQPIYVWPDGEIVFERPKSDWLERGLTYGE